MRFGCQYCREGIDLSLFPYQTRRDHIIENHAWEETYMEGKSFGATGSGYPSGTFVLYCIFIRSNNEGIPCELYTSRFWISNIYPVQLEYDSETDSGKEWCCGCVVGGDLENDVQERVIGRGELTAQTSPQEAS